MLPFAIFFKDEFRLLSAAQLFKGVQQATLLNSLEFCNACYDLGIPVPTQTPSSAELSETTPTLTPHPAQFQVLTSQEARHRFNVCLEEINRAADASEKGSEQAVTVNPADLQPNCTPENSHLHVDTLAQKLAALADIASSKGVNLILSQPTEPNLELWLELIRRTLEYNNPPPEETLSTLGITLAAQSKRLLPALGYLEKLAARHGITLTITLLQDAYAVSRYWCNGGPSPSFTTYTLSDPNFTLASQFLLSENCEHLQSRLAISRASILPTLNHIDSNNLLPLLHHDINAQRPIPAEIPQEATGIPNLQPGLKPAIDAFESALIRVACPPLKAVPRIAGDPVSYSADELKILHSPCDLRQSIGHYLPSRDIDIDAAIQQLKRYHRNADHDTLGQRVNRLKRFHHALLRQQLDLAALCAFESGKPIRDCLLETQQACRLLEQQYQQAPQTLTRVRLDSGNNDAYWQIPTPLGVVAACVPATQPIYAFVAQVSAIILTGNCGLIIPALKATFITQMLLEQLLATGTPAQTIAYLPGLLGSTENRPRSLGSLDAALLIGNPALEQSLVALLQQGKNPIPLLTNTGGQHIAIVDSSRDFKPLTPMLLRSALTGNGLAARSLRAVFVEETMIDEFEKHWTQAQPWIAIGDPLSRACDLGPLPSRLQMDHYFHYLEQMQARGFRLREPDMPEETLHGCFVPPALIRLEALNELDPTITGPVIHLIPFKRQQTEKLIEQLNQHPVSIALTLFADDNALLQEIRHQCRCSEFSFNPSEMHPFSRALPITGMMLSGSGRPPGSREYLLSLVRFRSELYSSPASDAGYADA